MFSTGNQACPGVMRQILLCFALLGFVLMYFFSTSIESSSLGEKDSSTGDKFSMYKPKKDGKGAMNMQIISGCDSEKDDTRSSNNYLPESNVESFFNCYLESTACTYFYPANFFDEECGIGQAFAEEARIAELKRKNRTLWNHMPSIGYPTLTMSHTCIPKSETNQTAPSQPKQGPLDTIRAKNNVKSDKGWTLSDIGERTVVVDGEEKYCFNERLSFLHVHKSGGTSLHNAFNKMSSNNGTSLFRHKWFQPFFAPGNSRTDADVSGEVDDSRNRMYGIAKEDMKSAITYPAEKFDSNEHVVIAVVRDPVERFISSIGQASGGSGSTGNMIGKVLKKECIKPTSKETLTCYAKYVKKHGYWIELHFTPQILDIWFSMLWQDAPLGVFPFTKLEDIVSHLGMPSAHGRDGTKGHYRSDDVLMNMTVADYDAESLQIVCEIYKMDVIMQRSIGIEVPRCDPYIPR